MESKKLYFRELVYLKNYILLILTVTLMSYSVYFYLDEASIASIGDEDHFFESMTSLCFLFCSVIFLYISAKKRNIIYLLLGAAFFFGFGEEISWGQRIFGFGTPQFLNDLNMQKEFNFHNIMTWEINFLFKLFTLFFGLILPCCAFHLRSISRLARIVKMPVPPVTLGIFFLADWIIFRMFLAFVLVKGATPKYYFACTEIYEFVTSFILLVISIYFLDNRTWIKDGVDIKEQFVNESVKENTQFIPLKSLIKLFSGVFSLGHFR